MQCIAPPRPRHRFRALIAGEIATVDLTALAGDIGILIAGQMRGSGNVYGINFGGVGGIPSGWLSGINFENTTIPGGMATLINFDTTASEFFIKHAEFELKHPGESAPLARFMGQVDITAPELNQSLQNFHLVLRDPDVAHGMTGLVETDIAAAFGLEDGLAGGLRIMGFREDGNDPAIQLQGTTGGNPDTADDATTHIVGFKKTGTTRTTLADAEYILTVSNGFSDHVFSVLGNRVSFEKTLAYQDNTPAQITANRNDYDPWGSGDGDKVWLRVSSDAEWGITGLAGGFNGRVVIIFNAGANRINLSHENANSAAANRFDNSTSAQISLLASGDSVTYIYDGAASRWRDVGHNVGL